MHERRSGRLEGGFLAGACVPLSACVFGCAERLYEFVSRELRVTWKTKCNDTITTKRANKTYTIHQTKKKKKKF